MILNAKNPLDGLLELHAQIVQQVGQYQNKADETFPPVAKVGSWPKASDYLFGGEYRLSSSQDYFKHKVWGYGPSSAPITTEAALTARKEELDKLVDQLTADIEACAENNKVPITSNLALHEKVKLVMRQIGIPDTFYVTEVPPRGRVAKSVQKQAGYLLDLGRCIPTTIQGSKPDVASIRRQIVQSYDAAVGVIRKAEYDRAAKEKQERNIHELALLRAKYCPDDAHASPEDIRDALLAKNKYLCLAYWLERNRGDWSDGYMYARIGYDSFSVETPLDKEIDEEISSLLDDDDGYIDGRCFRDCEYNYGVLYGMVEDEALLKDLEKLKEMDNT